MVSDGAIFIYQIDERNIVREEKFETFGTAEQRIQADYDGVMESNPSLHPQLIMINGMLAYAVDSCNDCGIQTANFTDGTFIQKSTSTETKIKFIDEKLELDTLVDEHVPHERAHDDSQPGRVRGCAWCRAELLDDGLPRRRPDARVEFHEELRLHRVPHAADGEVGGVDGPDGYQAHAR